MQYAALCGKDVTINILDSATVPKGYETPAFDATVTVTGGTLSTNNRFVMNGKFVFANLTINPLDTLVMAAKEHKLVMGEGLTMTGKSIYLVGGYESSLCSNNDIPATGFATDITLRSGTYGAVGGGNRYLSGKYSGTIKLTLGKTNKNDTLEITSTLTTASMNSEGGDGVNATIIIDGTVDDINSFCPVSHATTANGRFDIDLVVKGAAVTDTSKLYWRGANYAFTAYADERVDGAEEFAASVVGAENVQPYSRYCVKVNGAHPDAEEDGFCDNCGASTDCAHAYGEWRETAAANCVSAEKYVWYCFDCKEAIADMTKEGDAVDATNHVSENFVWQYADGAYFFACTACGENVPQDAPVLYVAQSGDNALDGTTPAKAVATVEEAVSRLANVGGKVVIVGTYVLEGNLQLPAYSEEITICGMESAGEFDGFSISKNVVITFGGKTKMDNISFGGSAIYIFECAWNDTVFGCVQPYGTATAYVVLGYYGITADDTDAASATLTVTEGTSQRHTSSGVRYVDRFYAYIYLGDTIGAEGVAVANKTAVLNATNADIGILYTMSTTAKYKNAPVTGCETTVNLYGSAKVDKGRTGDYNVGYAESNAVLDKQTLNFFDNAFIGSNYYIRNAKETVINVSTVADGRTIPLRVPFTFYAYGTFANDKTPMQMTVNCDSHSFASVVEAPCAFAKAADAVKVYSEYVANVCAYTAKVTEAATPTANGTKLYSCSCGRKYTENYAYSCADATHLYTLTDGAYVCDVCGETFTAPEGDNLFVISAVTVADGKATVVLNIDGNFAAALIKIAAPEGFTFESAVLPTADGFTASGSEQDGYTLALLANNGEDTAIDAALTLVYTCDTQEEGLFAVSVSEFYAEDGVATTVGYALTAHTHVYNATVTAPTCTADGFTTYTCACGETYIDDTVAATGHFYDGGVIDPPAAPGVPGVKTYTCTACGDTYTEEVPALAAAAKIGDTLYETVADAFAAAVEGDTIVALEKITVSGSETWDLTGKTLVLASIEGNYAVVVKGDLTIVGGTFVSNGEFGFGVTGKLTVQDGNFTCTHPEGYLLGTWGVTEIYGGIFRAVYNNANAFAGKLTVYGGDFAIDGYAGEYESADLLAAENAATVYGGSFSTDPSAFVADGFIAIETDGVWGIVSAPAEDVLGDMNGDGAVTVVDVLFALKAMLNGTFTDKADMNGDGVLTLLDIIKLLKIVTR